MTPRFDIPTAEKLLENYPPHRWYNKSLKWLLEQEVNQKNIPRNPLNDRLLQSLTDYGFMSPFLCMDNWYPICGSQRLRAALELPEEVLEQTVVRVMKLDTMIWMPFYYWGDKEEGHKCAAIYMQMIEAVFKSLYMTSSDPQGTKMTVFEEEGNGLHWECRDGKK